MAMVTLRPESLPPLVDPLQGHFYSLPLQTLPPVEAVTLQKPHLLVLDVMLPGLSGYEVCQRLKADPKTHDIPILMAISQ